MEGTVRVFAGEFSRSAYSMPGSYQPASSGVLTPGGAWCNRVFITGALTEITDHGSVIRCRLADPTGAFTLEITREGRTDLPEIIQKIPVPAFLAVTGRAQILKGDHQPLAIIRPDSLIIVDRSARDTWVIKTADCTLQRVAALVSALNGDEPGPGIRAVIDRYHTTRADVTEILAMVESALCGLAPVSPAPPQPRQDFREVITGIIRDLQGARGVAIDEVIAQARLRGIPREDAQGAIDGLIREDECYQPQKGTVRLL